MVKTGDSGRARMRAATIAAGIAVAAASVGLPTNASAVTIMGSGNNSCGRWLEQRKDGTPPLALTWVIGYLTRAAKASGRDLLKDPDADALMAWLDNYCGAHPLDNVNMAAEGLERELLARTPQSEAPRP